jgi:hypothetical protein
VSALHCPGCEDPDIMCHGLPAAAPIEKAQPDPCEAVHWVAAFPGESAPSSCQAGDPAFGAAIRETVAGERVGVVLFLQKRGVAEAIWKAIERGEHRGQSSPIAPAHELVFTSAEYRAVQRSRDEALAEVLRLKGVNVSDTPKGCAATDD